MESLIVHPKNQMELNALKSVMKEMGIKYEKFHNRTLKPGSASEGRPGQRKTGRPSGNFRDKPKNGE